MSVISAIRRRIFPSRVLARYVARMFVIRFFVFLIGLTVILQVLDLMGKSDNILEGEGATYASLVKYLSLRVPQLLSQFTPFAALLGVVSSFISLNQHSEIVVMKATGLSAYRILSPCFAIALAIAVLHFAFHETVVVKANGELKYWEANDFSMNLGEAPTTSAQSWLVDGGTVIEVESVNQIGRILTLENVRLYQRNAEAVLTSIAVADLAVHTDGNWVLRNVDRFTLPDFTLTRSAMEPWPISIPAERFVALAVKPDEVSFMQLRQGIEDLEAEGYSTDILRGALYHKLARPLSSVLMPLLGAVAAFGLARGGHLFIRVVIGVGLGFTFFVLDSFTMAMSEFGAAPPILSAWSPFLVFLLLGLSVLFYTEE